MARIAQLTKTIPIEEQLETRIQELQARAPESFEPRVAELEHRITILEGEERVLKSAKEALSLERAVADQTAVERRIAGAAPDDVARDRIERDIDRVNRDIRNVDRALGALGTEREAALAAAVQARADEWRGLAFDAGAELARLMIPAGRAYDRYQRIRECVQTIFGPTQAEQICPALGRPEIAPRPDLDHGIALVLRNLVSGFKRSLGLEFAGKQY